MIHFVSTLSISHNTALELLNICIQKANELRIPVSICVADSSGNEILSFRMDSAALITLSTARDIAKKIILIKHTDLSIETYNGVGLFYHDELIGAISVSANNKEAEFECLEFIKSEFQKL